MKKEVVIPVIVTALVFGAGGFFGGMQIQKSQGFKPGEGDFVMQGSSGQRFGGGGQRVTQGVRSTAGEIIALDDQSITVKMEDGSSKIVFVNDQSSVSESTASGRESLTVGKKVMIFGSNNQDGSITAQNIQLNPQGSMIFNRPPQ